ncbi:XapX domain-containing protein [Gottfriedia sp. NPDC057991]|uniref:XapX domain-containing protein n=1 Tax=Gottfriedia sp. NPDC057991 TaxID=3346298 RepID=UPI0036D9830D
MALLAGVIVEALFTLIKLPIPAPPVLSGIMGIVGVYSGAKLVEIITTKFFKYCISICCTYS